MEIESSNGMFISHMSHELRTPLNVIVGMCEIAKRHIDERERVLECLDKISIAGEHLTEIVDSVIDITRMTQGRNLIKEETFVIDDFVKEMNLLLEPLAVKNSIVLEISARDVINREIVADYVNIMHVITNLATNAIKYTTNGGFVKVHIIERPCSIEGMTTYEFICKDNGIGMSEEFLGHIFEPFSRAEDIMVRQIKGSGLGMAIVKSIIDLLEGNIQINSCLGEGTEVRVLLDVKVSEKNKVKVDVSEVRKRQKEELEERKIVLIAEDETDNCEVLVAYLNDMGYEADIATNGEDVVDMFMESEEGFYKAVLMDIEMPVLNGYQASIMIRGLNRQDSNLPVIAMTANAFEADKQKAAHSGIDHYMTKPIKMEQLEELLDNII